VTTYASGTDATLTVQWLQYAGGPPADVTSLTITITLVGGATVVGPTSTGIVHVATGLYAFTWHIPANATAGDYAAVWDGVNASSQTVQASEIITVVEATGDRLASPEDLASLLERDDIDAYKAGVLVEIATAVVQDAAGGQRIVQVVNDSFDLIGTTDAWLDLPQIPVTAVASVTLDGKTLTSGTDYKRFGNRLWRRFGWQSNWGQWDNPYPTRRLLYDYCPPNEPSAVNVVCTHGYPPGDQKLQLGRSAVLSMCTGAYGNPQGLRSESIDDYSATYGALSGQLEASPHLKAAIRRHYGRRGGLVRVG
jgi:hypothetical protein